MLNFMFSRIQGWTIIDSSGIHRRTVISFSRIHYWSMIDSFWVYCRSVIWISVAQHWIVMDSSGIHCGGVIGLSKIHWWGRIDTSRIHCRGIIGLAIACNRGMVVDSSGIDCRSGVRFIVRCSVWGIIVPFTILAAWLCNSRWGRNGATFLINTHSTILDPMIICIFIWVISCFVTSLLLFLL